MLEYKLSESIQIINRKIDVSKFNQDYYDNLRRELKKKVKKSVDIVLINFIPNEPLDELWKVWALIELQMEFTEIIIIPNTYFTQEEIYEGISHLRPIKILWTY